MMTKHVVMTTLALLVAAGTVPLAALAITDPTKVFVYNNVESGAGEEPQMTVQCSSKDNQLPSQTLNYGGLYQWYFQLDVFHKTLFWCDVEATFQGYGTMHLHFVAYNKEREAARLVIWNVQYDGLYVVNDITKSTDSEFYAGWTTE